MRCRCPCKCGGGDVGISKKYAGCGRCIAREVKMVKCGASNVSARAMRSSKEKRRIGEESESKRGFE